MGTVKKHERFFHTPEKDIFSVHSNEWGETKEIGKAKEFILYMNFMLKYDNHKEVTTIWEALDSFQAYYAWPEVWGWMEIFITYWK